MGKATRLLHGPWRVLGSTRLAAILLALLLTVSLLASLFPRMPTSPAAQETWLAAVALRYGNATRLFHTLGLFDAYHTSWFLALLAALLLNTLICTVQRLPRLWRSLVEPPTVARPPAFYLGFAHRAEWPIASTGDGLIAAESTLTRRHYRAHADRDEDTGLAYLYAERCRWAQAGTIVSHLAALGLALAVVARPALSWQETDLILLPGQTLDVGHGRDMAVGLGDLKLETDPDGQTRSIRALLLLQVGDSPPITRTVGFNDPATHRGVSFHLQGYGRGARLTTPEGDRHLAFTGSQTHEVALTETGPALRIAYQPDEDALFVEAQAADGTMLGSGLVADGQEIKVQGIPVTFALSHYTLWQVSHDPTFAPALAAAAVLLAGMVFSLWLPYRRLWLRLDGKCAQMVGAGAFDGEFEDMAGEMMAAARSTGGPAGDIPLPEGDADG